MGFPALRPAGAGMCGFLPDMANVAVDISIPVVGPTVGKGRGHLLLWQAVLQWRRSVLSRTKSGERPSGPATATCGAEWTVHVS